MKYHILDEHAWISDGIFYGEVKLQLCNSDLLLVQICEDEKKTYFLKKQSFGDMETFELTYDEMIHSDYVDFFMIVTRMIRDLKGRYVRTRYEILQKRTRMVDNLYGKIPESEIEVEFFDGERIFLFAYQSSSFTEYGISKLSWMDQDMEGYTIDRDKHILESYDSLQECMESDYSALFLELHEMMCNAEDFPDELYTEDEEYLPGYYDYE